MERVTVRLTQWKPYTRQNGDNHPWVVRMSMNAEWHDTRITHDHSGLGIVRRPIVAYRCTHPSCTDLQVADLDGDEIWCWGTDDGFRQWMQAHWYHPAHHGVQQWLPFRYDEWREVSRVA